MSDQPIDIRPDHEALVRDILLARLPKGVRVWAFGSRAKWLAKPYSDLDLALEAADCLPDALIADLKDEFRESDLPWKVDVLDLNAITPSFRVLIDKDRVVFPVREKRQNMRLGDYTSKIGSGATHRGGKDIYQTTVYGKISDAFLSKKLVDLCEPKGGVQTGPFGSQLHKRDYVLAGTPIITVEHLGENRILHSDTPFVSDEDRDRLSKYSLQQGDIVFSRVGSVDRRAVVHPEEEGWLFSGRCLRVRSDSKQIHSGYLSYFFGLPVFQDYIRSIAVGATMPSLNTKLLGGVQIYYPALPEQRAIASVLGSLDDKIDLNRRMNETLEAMARAIFKDWFVDFGPTRAKMEGREPYLAPEIWEMFPEKLGEDGLPEGWETSEIGKETTVVGGSTPSTKESLFWGGGINWATPKDLSALKSPVLLDTNRTITDVGLEKISSGLLPTGTVLLSSRAPIGYVAVAAIPVAVNQGFIALRCDGRFSNVYVWLWLHENMEAIKGNANGSTFQEISKKNFRPLPVVVPLKEIMEELNGIVIPLYERIKKNELESRTFSQTRDLLLPKLMSGEIRVREAAEITKALQ